MVDFTIHDIDSAPEAARPVMEATKKRLGFVPNMLAGLAESPATAKGYGTLMGILGESSFTPAEQQILMLTVSRANNCEYCVAAHSGGAKMAGAVDEVIEALRDGATVPDARIAALTTFCTRMVETRGEVAGAEVDAFIAAGFTRAQLLEVLLAIAVKTISNYYNHIAETPLDEKFQPLAWSAGKAA